VNSVVYDAGVLVAADKNQRQTWAEHKARLELGVVPIVPAPVVAQVSRSPRQVQLRRFLTGCVVVPLGEVEAYEAGRLLGITRTADVVDAVVATIAPTFVVRPVFHMDAAGAVRFLAGNLPDSRCGLFPCVQRNEHSFQSDEPVAGVYEPPRDFPVERRIYRQTQPLPPAIRRRKE
jgi:hypothetical protein